MTGISEGTCSIKVSNVTNGFIYDTNAHDLVYGESVVIDKHVYLNGSAVSQPVTYSLVYSDKTTTVPATLATISVDGSNIATVTNANTGTAAESIYVKAVLDIDNTIVSYYALTLDFQVAVSKSITLTPSSATYVDITASTSGSKTFTATVYNETILAPEDVAWHLYADDQVSEPTAANQTILSQTTSAITIRAVKATFYV